jgi:transposase
MGEGTGVLPTDISALQQLVVRLQSEVSFFSSRATVLEEELRLLRHKVFGRRSERFSEEEKKQSVLFNEVGDAPDVPSPQEATIEVAAHQRAKRGRRPLPADLLRQEMVHDIPESEKICSCGAPLVRIGEETSEKLDVIPVQLKVIVHVRPKYACRKCEGLDSAHPVKIAPVPPQIIEKSIATPGLFGVPPILWTP